MPVPQLSHPAQHLLTLRLLEDGDDAPGTDQRDERLAIDTMDVLEVAALHGSDAGEHLEPSEPVLRQAVLSGNRGQVAHPCQRGGAEVPHQAERPAGSQDPNDLLEGRLDVEPVEGLTGDHGVNSVIGQRERFGTAFKRSHAR